MRDAIVTELIAEFQTGYGPTRATLLQRLKENHPQLVHPRLEYTLAQVLYKLENDGFIERVGGKWYKPTGKMIAGGTGTTGKE